jgi:pimeloyl-ACP methyl ester carboxylesterase
MARLEIDDGKIAVRGLQLEVVHRGTGPLLLLLHGAGGIDPSAAFLELLARHFEVVAPSHPGFGNSPLPDLFDSVDDLAYVYLDLLEQFDLRDVTLAGFSLGGWIAAEVAVRCAHRLSRLILVGPVGIKAGDRETRDIPDIFALPPRGGDAAGLPRPAKGRGQLRRDVRRAAKDNRAQPPIARALYLGALHA